MFEKLKSFLADDTIYVALLVVLVGVVSFGLGRQSVAGEGVFRPAPTVSIPMSEGVIVHDALNNSGTPTGVTLIEAPTTTIIAPFSPDQPQDKVVASRSGTKYHLLVCPGAAQIKDENKIYFESAAHAKAAGYSPAANCPGLR
jgi:hypothetical protein